MARIAAGILLLVGSAACGGPKDPSHVNTAHDAIDYARPEAWLARPGLISEAMKTPRDSGWSDLQATARADAFYVHPTTGMRADVSNVPIDDAEALETSRVMLMSQATPFNGVARVFAPRYRQIALHVYDEGEDALQAPMNRAYEDVRRAFRHYVDHHNQGRPFFIVAHSQGSNHALRLLSEEVQGKPVEASLVAAYLPGMPTPRSVFEHDLTRIAPCAAPEQTGCVAVWGVFGEGYTETGAWEAGNVYWDAPARRWRSAAGAPLVNVNPVSWTDDGAPTPASLHRGAVPFGAPGTHFSRTIEELVSARVERYTWVSPVPLPPTLFNDGGVFGGSNYHVFDISLFWVDLRENARRRLVAFLRSHDDAARPLVEGPIHARATVGVPFSLSLAVRGAPVDLDVRGLPEGLALDPATATIAGAPAAPGRHVLRVTATNALGSDTAELALRVDEIEP